MEPVSIGLGALAWKYGVEPVMDSLKKEYGESVKLQLKDSLARTFDKLPFKRQDIEIIEGEIVNANIEVLTDEKKFLNFIQNNIQIENSLALLRKKHTDKVVLNSFKNISNSSIKVPGAKKDIKDSFENIKDSQINI